MNANVCKVEAPQCAEDICEQRDGVVGEIAGMLQEDQFQAIETTQVVITCYRVEDHWNALGLLKTVDRLERVNILLDHWSRIDKKQPSKETS